MSRLALALACGLAIAGLLSSSHFAPAQAAPAAALFMVNSQLDQIDENVLDGLCHTASGACTLRAAVMQANNTSGIGATILLPAGTFTLTIPATGADDATSGDLNLATPTSGDPLITIQGAGAASTIIDANGLDRVFVVNTDRTASLRGLTLLGGYNTSSGYGGGIQNLGHLTIDHVTVTGNNAGHEGGGIYNAGELMVTDSTIGPDNVTTGGGGGGGIDNFGGLTVERSTISGNRADGGGGLYNYVAATLINATFSGNYAAINGGAIYNHNTVNAYNLSVVANSADDDDLYHGAAAAGIYNSNTATFNLRNSLVAGNSVAMAPVYYDCLGTLGSYGNNLFGDDSTCMVNDGAGGSHALLNSLALLGGLQDNGGPTLTHALLRGSNAIDGGDPAQGCLGPSGLLATDQRGAARAVGARCDVGAFEYLPPVLFLSFVHR